MLKNVLFLATLLTATQISTAYKSVLPGVTYHEDMSEAAWKQVYGNDKKQIQLFKDGTAFPDVPCENNSDNPTTCPAEMGGDAVLGTTCTVYFRMTYADLATWHSMSAGQPGITNSQVRDGIFKTIKGYWDYLQLSSTPQDRQIFALGKIAHAIQDSWSASHTQREPSTKKILAFSYYGAQDKHGDADKVINDDLFKKASESTVKLVQLYKDRATWDQLKSWLMSDVYAFYDDASANAESGGSDSKFGCNGRYCKSPKFSAPSRTMKVTVVNNSPNDVTFDKKVTASSGGGCWSCAVEKDGTQYPAFEAKLPCATIKKGETCTWQMESCGIMTGLEATVTYKRPDGSKFDIWFRNPWSQLYKNDAKVTGINARVDKSKIRGDNAQVSIELLG